MRAERTILGPIEPWLRAIGLVIWAFCGVSRFDGAPQAWVVPWLLYGVAMVAAGFRVRLPRRAVIAILAAQSLSVLALPRLGLPGFEGMLLSFVVVQLPTVVSMRTAIIWALLHIPPLVPLTWPFNNARQMVEMIGAYSSFSTFALLVHWVRQQERRARTALARSNASLLATRAMLVEGSQQTERLRISRELHDSLGHHLTALNLQLDLARRLASGKSAEALERAKAVASESLAEVRKVVASMQTREDVDVVAALKALAGGLPSPHITITAPESLALESGEANHALFRCVQEAITNAVKHSAAKNVWVELSQHDGRVDATVRDDGEGVSEVTPGRGLTGMRERIAQLGGEVQFESAPGRGFQVRLQLQPRTTAAG